MAVSAEDVQALLKQREAVVGFGRMALQSNDIDVVLKEACKLCSDALGTGLAKIMKLQDDGRTLLVIAGTGWQDGVVGEETIPALQESSEGYALKTGVPAVSEDISEETRFDYAEFLKRHDVVALVNVIIPGGDGRPPYGLLQVDSRERREFGRSDIEFLQGYANIIGAALERHDYQTRLHDALDAKERLLRELQHRVMNNLSVLSSMLRIRSRKVSHPVVQSEIAGILSKIEVLAELHRKLSSAGSASSIDLGGYLAALCSSLAGFASNNQTKVEVATEIESVLVDVELAIPLGIVANEFITNSVKHGCIDGRCRISLRIATEEDELRIDLRDEGPGLGNALDHVDDETTGSGLGLIEGMLKQLEGSWAWDDDHGTHLKIEIPRSTRSLVSAKHEAI